MPVYNQELYAFLQSLVSRVTAQSIQANSAKFPRAGCSNNSSGNGFLTDTLILNDAAMPVPLEAQLAEKGHPVQVQDSLTPP